jgi:phosphoribosylglycinamide formyltransferase-1
MYGIHVHEAVLASGAKISGATVHLVDEEYDHGPIVLQKAVPVLPDDTPATLASRVLAVEHEIYPLALCAFAEGRVRIIDQKAWVMPSPSSGSAAT